MATTTENLTARIQIDVGDSTKNVKDLEKELKDLNGTINKSGNAVAPFSANMLKLGAGVLVAYEAVTKLIDVVSSGVIAFLDAEDAILKMNQALELTGSTTAKAATDSFVRLGDSIEAMGIASTESVLKLAKIGVAAGQTTAQTEELIRVAADLSVAREIPIDAAFKALSATLKGSAGQLSAFLPELKNLTEEQLKTGKAIEYVSLQVGGFAARNLETYAGKLALLKTRSGDVAESLGEILVKIVDLDNGIVSTTQSMERLNAWLQSSKEWIIALGQTIVSYLVDIWDAAIAKIRDWISFFQQVIGSAIYLFGKLQNITDKFGKRNEEWGLKLISMGDDILESAAQNREAYLNWSQGIEAVSVSTVKATSTATDYILKAREAKKALGDIRLSAQSAEQLENGKKLLDELIKKVNDLQKANAAAGKAGEEAIKAKYDADRKEIAAIKEKLEANKALTAEAQKYLSQASSLVAESQSLEIMKLRADTLKEINQQNSELETSFKQINATQREALDYELEARLKILKARREQISIEDKASLEALDRQEELLKQTVEKKKEALPSEGYEKLEQAGKNIADNISGALKQGGIGVAGGMLAAASLIVNAAHSLLDFFPNLINNVASLFNKLTDFPNVLRNAFQNLFSAAIRFISEFIPNLLKSIIDSLLDIDKFINGAIEAFKGLLAQLPSIIFSVLDQLPSIIENLISTLMTVLPEIYSSIITFIIEKGPDLFFRIMKSIYVDLPIAIVKGIIKGLKRIGEIVKNFFSGKGLKIDTKIDPKPLQQAASKFVGSASRIFKVGDVSEDVKDNLKNVTDGITEAFKKGTNWLKEAWMWVWEKIIMPIYNFIRDAWLWVWDNVLAPIANFLREAWLWVYDNVIKPIASVVMKAWQWVYDNVIKPIITVVTKAFQWVIDNVINPIREAITSAWQWVIDNVIAPLSELGAKIAKPFMDAINSLAGLFEGIGKLFQNLFELDFEGMKTAFKEIFQSAGESLMSIFRKIINPIIDLFNGLISAINGLKIPEIGWSISAGRLGSWDGTLIGETDLIPGEIAKLQKFAQGGLVEQGAFSLSGFGSDTVPSALTPGEFVVNRRGVEAGGLEMLSALNRGQTPSAGPVTVNIEVNVDAKTTMDEGYIRGTLIPRMTEELKRASLNGNFVISSRGIR